MRRLLCLAALALAAASAGACDLSPPAATVAGTTVSRSQLDTQLSEISQSPYAQCALQLEGVDLPTQLTGAGDDTVPSSLASYVLSTMVLEQLVDDRLAGQGHAVTASDLASARTDAASELTAGSSGSSPCPGQVEGQALLSRLPSGFRTQQIAFLAAQEKLAATLGHVDVSDTALRAYYEAHPSQFQELCLSDIAVESQSQAQSIHDAIASGHSSFASEAEQNSIDTQTAADGGQIPCVPSSEIENSVILGAVAGLSPGQISSPVFEAGSGSGGSGVWFVLQLDGRPDIPFSQAAPQIRQQLLSAENTEVSAEFSRLARGAHVTVDPRYGSWSPTAGIRPPATPPAADLLSRTADQAAGSTAASAAG